MSNDPARAAPDAAEPTIADAVTDPTMAPIDDDAGGPTANKPKSDTPSEEEIAAQLGDFA